MATQDEYIKTALRLPRDLHARIQESAEQTGKSMNAELIARLEGSFNVSADTDFASKFDRLTEQNDQLQHMLDEVYGKLIVMLKLDKNDLLKELLEEKGNPMKVEDLREIHEGRLAETEKRVRKKKI